jgi:SAM-dependent methyltransferase
VVRVIDELHARAAYEALAPQYDLLTAHHDYEAWTRDLERLARSAGLAGRRLLDVACGTGKSFLPFLERGYDVVACDISPAMAALAAAKTGDRARVEVHDMRALPRLGDFDLVLCLDDSVNYLLDRAELTAALRGMRANLVQGGVVVFDANCLSTYRGFFASLSVVPSSDAVVVWRGATDPAVEPEGFASAAVEVLSRGEDGAWTAATRRHLQRHHGERVVREAAAAAGLAIVAVHGMQPDGSFEDGFDELRNSKAVYVARRAQDHRPGAGT